MVKEISFFKVNTTFDRYCFNNVYSKSDPEFEDKVLIYTLQNGQYLVQSENNDEVTCVDEISLIVYMESNYCGSSSCFCL